jgi:hypothetical protein
VTGPFQQQPDGRLHGTVIVHNQDFRHRTFSPLRIWTHVNDRLQRFAEFGFARKQLGADVQLNLSKRCLLNAIMCTVTGRHASARRVDEFDSPEACEYRDTSWRLTPSLCGAQFPRAQTARRSGEISWE